MVDNEVWSAQKNESSKENLGGFVDSHKRTHQLNNCRQIVVVGLSLPKNKNQQIFRVFFLDAAKVGLELFEVKLVRVVVRIEEIEKVLVFCGFHIKQKLQKDFPSIYQLLLALNFEKFDKLHHVVDPNWV